MTTREPKHRAGSAVGRRIGYSVAVVVNAILLTLVNWWPGWEALPFVTRAAASVVVFLNAALVVGVLVNLANLVFDLRWVRALGEIITSTVSLVFLTQLWGVFPFAFETSPIDWATVARVVTGFAILGCVVGIVVQSVLLARILLGLNAESESSRVPSPGSPRS
ncbi:hypothetical protein [Microbacterium immunditiarum]|uniref:Small-conductance mechanosensitive channel n=1 Tax=Microbacterium immunditiarum TaxID=337480 RepID=A0A7Y9GM23_9MICO|nr:hypothetical protein [Microbacterium immunditiarum]NYE18979.1 small-conductance mechanosensitive channel [Microbacterium immunditiarum]